MANPFVFEKNIFKDLPVRTIKGYGMEHYCFICNKFIPTSEAADSSVKIRSLCKGESPYLWDVWVSDFCSECVTRFKTFGDFVNFIKERNNEKKEKST